MHYVRDVTRGEDASQVRSGAASQTTAGLRNVTLALLRRAGAANIAERLRTCAGRSAAAVALVLDQPTGNERPYRPPDATVAVAVAEG